LDKNSNANWAEPVILLDLAIAHHRWGHNQQAQEWLEKATRLLDQSGEFSPHMHERMEFEVLRQEAERLILGNTHSAFRLFGSTFVSSSRQQF